MIRLFSLEEHRHSIVLRKTIALPRITEMPRMSSEISRNSGTIVKCTVKNLVIRAAHTKKFQFVGAKTDDSVVPFAPNLAFCPTDQCLLLFILQSAHLDQ
jgi:hypothetical protein